MQRARVVIGGLPLPETGTTTAAINAIRAGVRSAGEGSKLLNMTPSSAFDRITVEPGKCGGKPCIRGLRITVRRLLEIMATYRDRDEIFREYPFLEEEDLQQALCYAAASVDDDVRYLNQVA